MLKFNSMAQPNTSRGGKIGLGCLGAILIGALLCGVGLVYFLLTSCSVNKPLVASDLPKPDRAFQTGAAAGYNVYVWECYRNKHIVVYNFRAKCSAVRTNAKKAHAAH